MHTKKALHHLPAKMPRCDFAPNAINSCIFSFPRPDDLDIAFEGTIKSTEPQQSYQRLLLSDLGPSQLIPARKMQGPAPSRNRQSKPEIPQPLHFHDEYGEHLERKLRPRAQDHFVCAPYEVKFGPEFVG